MGGRALVCTCLSDACLPKPVSLLSLSFLSLSLSLARSLARALSLCTSFSLTQMESLPAARGVVMEQVVQPIYVKRSESGDTDSKADGPGSGPGVWVWVDAGGQVAGDEGGGEAGDEERGPLVPTPVWAYIIT